MLPNNIEFVKSNDPRFPESLRRIGSPPPGLYVRGILEDVPSISIVGTRKNTTYGKRCVDEIVPDLVAAGFAIVSGMALGIDGLVHRAALDAGGKTVAVLGTGNDDASLYPRAHHNLAKEIIASGGAVVSEFSPGTPSLKQNFPMRNRIISGWSLATVVIEASVDSGSLITARQALDENREVLAVPGPIWSEVSMGCNRLISLGAKVCTSSADVLEALEFDRPELITQARASLPLTPEESRLLALLDQPTHIDDLAIADNSKSATVSSRLAMLELKGYVAQLGAQIWSRSTQRLRK